MASQLVLEAISAIKAGEKTRARKLLIQAIKRNSQDDDAWLVLAAVVPEKEQRIECLERALIINPQNERAKRALAKYKPLIPKFITQNKKTLGGLIAIVTLLATGGLCIILGTIIFDIETPTATPEARSEVQVHTPIPSETPPMVEPTQTNTRVQSTNTPIATDTKEAVYPGGFTCIPLAMPITGEVIQVVDGDTIDVLIGNKEFSVRYIGIDSPENNDPFGDQAYQFNRALVYGKQVDLYYDVSETDKFGRLLFYVFVGEKFINYELVRTGNALAVDYPPDTSCSGTYHEATNIAKQGALGIWAPTPKRSPTAKPPLPPVTGNVPASCTCKPPDLDCADFGTHNKAQACFEYCKSLGNGDYYRLDGDDDGSACESLP